MAFTTSQEAHWRRIVQDNFDKTLERAYIPELDDGKGSFYLGKVRDNYVVGDKRLLITTDRISVFDYIVETMPFKGQLLNQMALYFLEHTKYSIPNALINQEIDPLVMLQEQTTPIKLESIVRAYLTGGAWRSFAKEEFIKCGIDLRKYLIEEKKNERFTEYLFTPSEKSDTDPDISREAAIEKGIVSAKQFYTMQLMAFALFQFGEQYFRKKGLLLVDSKFEFGINKDGEIKVIDELFTPDSSRFWDADDYQDAYQNGREPKQLSKEFLRDILIRNGYDTTTHQRPDVTKEMLVETAVKYIELYELFTGKEFEPNLEDPKVRLLNNLKNAGIVRGDPFVAVVVDPYNDYKDKLYTELRKANIRYREISYEQRHSNQRAISSDFVEKELSKYCYSIAPAAVILLDANGLQLLERFNRLPHYSMNSHEIVKGIDLTRFREINHN